MDPGARSPNGGRVLQPLTFIVPATDDPPVVNNHSANRHVTMLDRGKRFVDGGRHESFRFFRIMHHQRRSNDQKSAKMPRCAVMVSSGRFQFIAMSPPILPASLLAMHKANSRRSSSEPR